MGWLSRLFGRSEKRDEQPPTFEEVEAQREAELAADYADTRKATLDDITAQLADDALTAPKVEKAEVPVDYHVAEAEADDLLVEAPLEDHYGMATGEAVDPKTADTHLKEAKATETDMDAYERVEVPVSDDDIDWQTNE